MTFENFWTIYPKTKGMPKAPARKAWDKLKMTEELWDQIRLGIQAQVRYRADAKNVGEWMPDWPMPSTYINQARWEMDIPPHADLKEKVSRETKTCRCGKPATHKGREAWVCASCWYDDWHDEPRVLHYSSLRKAEFQSLKVEKVTTWRNACLPVIWAINPSLAKLLGR